MSAELSGLLSSQHKRLIATLMGHVEREIYPRLSLEQRRELREVIVRAVGTYHDTALDCLKAVSSDESVVRNERLYEMLESIHRQVSGPTVPAVRR